MSFKVNSQDTKQSVLTPSPLIVGIFKMFGLIHTKTKLVYYFEFLARE